MCGRNASIQECSEVWLGARRQDADEKLDQEKELDRAVFALCMRTRRMCMQAITDEIYANFWQLEDR